MVDWVDELAGMLPLLVVGGDGFAILLRVFQSTLLTEC